MNKIIREIKKEIGWGPLAIAVLMVFKILGFSLLPITIISYIAIILIAFYNLKNGPIFDTLTCIFVLYIPLSLMVITGPDPIFKAWQRFTLFIFLMLAISPLIKNQKAQDFRQRLFKGTLLCCVLIGVISFGGYFVGINYMRSTWDGLVIDYARQVNGTFGGITSHSMLLAPISAIGSLTSIYLALIYKNKKFWVLAVMCMGSVMFASSRVSLVGVTIAVCVLILYSRRNTGKNVKRILGIVALAAITFPLWSSALKGIEAKNQSSLSKGINTGTRDAKWEIRLNEWEDSPVFGIGFCSVSKEDAIGVGGLIEPGSSWLAVLSMTGSIGFILFCILYIRALNNVMRIRLAYSALLAAVLIFFGLHMIAEGYIYSAGSFLCYFVWLSIGCATDYFYKPSVKGISLPYATTSKFSL